MCQVQHTHTFKHTSALILVTLHLYIHLNAFVHHIPYSDPCLNSNLNQISVLSVNLTPKSFKTTNIYSGCLRFVKRT